MITVSGTNIHGTTPLEQGFIQTLNKKTREQLRVAAHKRNLPVGRNKSDTIKNLIEASSTLDELLKSI